ncbi:MAG TPA: amidohydrolase family protein [Acidimicrobiia bacterium]|jgi:predicted TIM-barrel fold metal-dependent hydrolase
MTIDRVVDAHVHLWDPARADWYPFLSPEGGRALNMGDTSRMSRRFDQTTYFDESKRWNVEKFVHVAAAAPPHGVEETMELDEQADGSGHPDAIIGGLLLAEAFGDAGTQLDAHSASPRFRGVRIMGEGSSAIPTPAVISALHERDLVLDLMVHPDGLEDAARALAGTDLRVVVEHTGWPRTNTPEEYELWKAGMEMLAGLRENVSCKLSGLAMPLQSMDASVLRPWVEHSIETFGVDRCMFASNFPVDGNHGTYDDLYGAYDELTSGLGAADREKLFASNAEKMYRC